MIDTPQSPTRHPRRSLAAPFIVVGLLLAGWTGWWFYLTNQIETRLEARVEAFRQDGWTVTHAAVTTTGWPFRARVSIPHAEILAPSGHGVAAPELVAEANAYKPDRWVVIAPDGLTLSRADKGKVGIAGDGLRLSISRLDDRFPDLRIQLIRPTFTAHPDAEPFPVASAERIELYTRPHQADGPSSSDRMDVLFRLIDARGRSGGPVEGATRQGRLTVELEGTIEQADRLNGIDSAGVFARWTAAGGRFTAIRGELAAGESTARIRSDTLSAGPDGRLQGEVVLRAEQPMAAIAGLAGSQSGAVNRVGAAGAAAAAGFDGDREVDLVVQFRDGRTWLGPFALAPAPKLF
ncbi:MAG: DUF2125 domain-containing protein [Brevundimonas sp.]|uniref:DUF2125 domain-containing protein n=1 Tax=Brevundimonas sp. TaxID=1871086 RepID=UPI002720BC12|nr:DUF2125 domain-containing protein [Brevundimonas sp.]MDO9586950.1 DUF2125 domain-containing protein [Brevundimonas sp.]